MGQQPITGAFAAYNQPGLMFGINLEEIAGAGWSPGATITQPVAVQPALSERFAVVAWSISFTGTFAIQSQGSNSNGRLGRLIGGVFPSAQRTQGTTGLVLTPWVAPMLPLPESSTSLDVLWDGANDPPFPDPSASQPWLPTTVTQVPATPLEIVSGEDVSIGIWLTPSLFGPGSATKLDLWNARYSVVFDDGQPARAGWGG